jgi:hypothetical protein
MNDTARYSHRNGERTPPTVEGHYKFFGKRYGRHLGAKNIVVEVVATSYGCAVMESYEVGLAHYEGRWWGPVLFGEAVQP